MQSEGLAFGSIAFEIEAPEVTSNRSSSIGAIGSELGSEPMHVGPGQHFRKAELDHAPRDSAAHLAVARTRRRSSLRGCQPRSLSYQT